MSLGMTYGEVMSCPKDIAHKIMCGYVSKVNFENSQLLGLLGRAMSGTSEKQITPENLAEHATYMGMKIG